MGITAVIKGLSISPNDYNFNVTFKIPGEDNIREQINVPNRLGQTLELLQGELLGRVRTRIAELTQARTVAAQIAAWVETQPTVAEE